MVAKHLRHLAEEMEKEETGTEMEHLNLLKKIAENFQQEIDKIHAAPHYDTYSEETQHLRHAAEEL